VTSLEILAAVSGVISVYLGTRQSVWSWPIGIVNVAIYFVVFLQARLYAGAGLQIVYLLLALYGWYQWLPGGADRSTLAVSRSTLRTLGTLLPVNVLAGLALGGFLGSQTNAALPWLDSLLTTTSLLAQWLLTRKKVETWMLWIVVDLVYVPMYISQGLYATAGLYAVFLGLAGLGLRDWTRSMTAVSRSA
jgi:nicotinamide mononucleotide transporter